MAEQATQYDGAGAPQRILFARQPILDLAGRLAAYELLPHGDGVADAALTPHVVVSALSDVGLRDAAAGAPAHVDVTAEFLLAMDPMPFGPETAVLELPASTEPTAELLDRVDRLREYGYPIVLDGVTASPDLEPLLARAVAGKVDMRLHTPEQAGAIADRLARLGLKAIADGVETHETSQQCAAMGFELFQGDFVQRPRAVHGQAVPAASLGHVRMAAGLAGTGSEIADIERAIAFDPGLSLRLLRFVNSAAFYLRHRINSVRHAIVMLGPRTVRQWAMMLLLAGVEEEQGPLLTTALARGKTCQLIAERLRASDVEGYYFVGLFSVVDALLDTPMEEILETLPLSDEVVAALTTREGGKGRALAMTEACERGDWDEAAVGDITADDLAVLHAESLAWADQIAAGLAS